MLVQYEIRTCHHEHQQKRAPGVMRALKSKDLVSRIHYNGHLLLEKSPWHLRVSVFLSVTVWLKLQYQSWWVRIDKKNNNCMSKGYPGTGSISLFFLYPVVVIYMYMFLKAGRRLRSIFSSFQYLSKLIYCLSWIFRVENVPFHELYTASFKVPRELSKKELRSDVWLYPSYPHTSKQLCFIWL